MATSDPSPAVTRASFLPGPPLNLERPGRIAELLSRFVLPARLDRMRGVLACRTRRLTGLLEGVHDPHNVSACMRTCDGLGIQDLHVVPQAGVEMEPNHVVASGTERWLTVHVHRSTEEALEVLQAAGYRVFATDLSGTPPPLPVAKLPVDTSICIAFGTERDGISETLRAACVGTTSVPMYGFVDSFNISVAFALVMQSLRGRMFETSADDGDLPSDEQRALLDQWLLEEVPRAPDIIDEMVRRASMDGA